MKNEEYVRWHMITLLIYNTFCIAAVILIPYSVHSYFGVELANLAIPIFVPSVQYFAK